MVQNTVCSTHGCLNKMRAKGLCIKCYQKRWKERKRKDPSTIGTNSGAGIPRNGGVSREEWFEQGFARVDNGCLEWQRTTFKSGYGSFENYPGIDSSYVHVIAWTIVNGPPPPGLEVCHSCDNPPCGDIEHLWLGTNKENLDDMRAKGRNPRGERSGNAKLTEADVRAIRARAAAGETYSSISRDYEVDRKAIENAAKRKTWKHVG